MSSNASLVLALRDEPQAVMLTTAQLNVIANTEFVPKSMRGNVPKVLACVARGRAMGIPDAVALGGIDIIEGNATLSAELMCAIVRRHGHSIVGNVDATKAVVKGTRRDNGDTMTAEFNLDMAQAAGLAGKNNWKKHPDDMMWARAVSKLCRRLFADCFAGGTYAPEDMQPTADETMDEPADDGMLADGMPALEVSEVDIFDGETALAALEALRQDFDAELIGAKGGELFPGRSAKSLSVDEIGELRAALTVVNA